MAECVHANLPVSGFGVLHPPIRDPHLRRRAYAVMKSAREAVRRIGGWFVQLRANTRHKAILARIQDIAHRGWAALEMLAEGDVG